MKRVKTKTARTLGLQLLNHRIVRTQVRLGADEDDRHVRGVVLNFRHPLAEHVLVRRRRDDGEADEEDLGAGVRQRAQTIIVLLA